MRSLLDILVVQPTGSGKSAIYQIAGLMISGATLVVSPLIALQKDQLESEPLNVPGQGTASKSGIAGQVEGANVSLL